MTDTSSNSSSNNSTHSTHNVSVEPTQVTEPIPVNEAIALHQEYHLGEISEVNEIEEEDITESMASAPIVHIQPLPEPNGHIEEQDSISEEDVTEESDNNIAGTLLYHPTETTSTPILSTTATNSASRSRSVSNVNPTSSRHTTGLLPRSQRIWEMDRQAPECRRCFKRFNFLVRRHHCRRCGQIVCDKCSSNRLRLPIDELIEDPMISASQYPLLATQSQRVCDTCYREPITRRSSVDSSMMRRTAFSQQMRRSDSSQSLMIDCPVCNRTFLGMPKSLQEDHLKQCLNIGSPPVQSPRYIVYTLTNDNTQIGEECPICFDEFKKGDKVSRMICLCSYHANCLADWLKRGKGCPIHYDTILG